MQSFITEDGKLIIKGDEAIVARTQAVDMQAANWTYTVKDPEDGDLKVMRPFNGTDAQTVVFDTVCHYFRIINDGSTDITFTIGSKFADLFTFTVQPNDIFDERVAPFDRVRILNAGKYRGWVRGVPGEWRWSVVVDVSSHRKDLQALSEQYQRADSTKRPEEAAGYVRLKEAVIAAFDKTARGER